MKDKGHDFDRARHPPPKNTLGYTRWCQDLLPADWNHLAIKARSKKTADSQFRAFLSDTALAQKSVAKEQLNPSPFP